MATLCSWRACELGRGFFSMKRNRHPRYAPAQRLPALKCVAAHTASLSTHHCISLAPAFAATRLTPRCTRASVLGACAAPPMPSRHEAGRLSRSCLARPRQVPMHSNPQHALHTHRPVSVSHCKYCRCLVKPAWAPPTALCGEGWWPSWPPSHATLDLAKPRRIPPQRRRPHTPPVHAPAASGPASTCQGGMPFMHP